MILRWPGKEPTKFMGCNLINITAPLSRNAGYVGDYGIALTVKSHWEDTESGEEVNVIDDAKIAGFGRKITPEDARLWLEERGKEAFEGLDKAVLRRVCQALMDAGETGLTAYALSRGKTKVEGITSRTAVAYLKAALAEERRVSGRRHSLWVYTDQTFGLMNRLPGEQMSL
jgi:hypothetical protein